MGKKAKSDFVDQPIDDDATFSDDLDSVLNEPLEGELVDELPPAPLSVDDARQLTDNIRGAAEMLWMLIARAHAGKAWEALGFSSWESYVREEFDMSRSRSYQLLDQARVIEAISAALPEGANVGISEAAARDLKGVLDEIVPSLRESTYGLAPDEASVVLDEIVEEQRDRLREEREAAYDEVDDDSQSFEEYGGKSDGDYKGNGPPKTDDADDFDDDNDPIYDDVDDLDVHRIRRNVNAAHDLYSSLSALASLPDNLDDVLAIIPDERHQQINGNLAKAQEKLNVFAELWRKSSVNDREDEEYEDY